jgi:DNA-binding CsgD family transcriptional regulator
VQRLFLWGGEGRSYRWVARDLAISKNTVADIAKRNRASGE